MGGDGMAGAMQNVFHYLQLQYYLHFRSWWEVRDGNGRNEEMRGTMVPATLLAEEAYFGAG